MDNLHSLFQPLILLLQEQRKQREEKDSNSTVALSQPQHHTSLKEKMSQIGARVKIKWTANEIGDSGWRPGWYVADVHAYDAENDLLTVEYPSEPNCTYTIDLTSLFHNSKIQLIKAVI